MIKKSIEKRIATITVTTVALTSLFTAAAPLPRSLSMEFADIKGLVNPRYSVTEQLNRNIDYRPYKLTFHIWRDPFSAEYAAILRNIYVRFTPLTKMLGYFIVLKP